MYRKEHRYEWKCHFNRYHAYRATALCLTMHSILLAVYSNILQIKETVFTSRAPLFVVS
jgi:hypothetical protein